MVKGELIVKKFGVYDGSMLLSFGKARITDNSIIDSDSLLEHKGESRRPDSPKLVYRKLPNL